MNANISDSIQRGRTYFSEYYHEKMTLNAEKDAPSNKEKVKKLFADFKTEWQTHKKGDERKNAVMNLAKNFELQDVNKNKDIANFLAYKILRSYDKNGKMNRLGNENIVRRTKFFDKVIEGNFKTDAEKAAKPVEVKNQAPANNSQLKPEPKKLITPSTKKKMRPKVIKLKSKPLAGTSEKDYRDGISKVSADIKTIINLLEKEDGKEKDTAIHNLKLIQKQIDKNEIFNILLDLSKIQESDFLKNGKINICTLLRKAYKQLNSCAAMSLINPELKALKIIPQEALPPQQQQPQLPQPPPQQQLPQAAPQPQPPQPPPQVQLPQPPPQPQPAQNTPRIQPQEPTPPPQPPQTTPQPQLPPVAHVVAPVLPPVIPEKTPQEIKKEFSKLKDDLLENLEVVINQFNPDKKEELKSAVKTLEEIRHLVITDDFLSIDFNNSASHKLCPIKLQAGHAKIGELISTCQKMVSDNVDLFIPKATPIITPQPKPVTEPTPIVEPITEIKNDKPDQAKPAKTRGWCGKKWDTFANWVKVKCTNIKNWFKKVCGKKPKSEVV